MSTHCNTLSDLAKSRLLDQPKPPKFRHYDWVSYQFGTVGNVGQIVASGRDGVRLELEDGREIPVPHGALVAKADPPVSRRLHHGGGSMAKAAAPASTYRYDDDTSAVMAKARPAREGQTS